MHCEYALFKTRLFFRNVLPYFDLIHIPIFCFSFAHVRFSHFHSTKSCPSMPNKKKKEQERSTCSWTTLILQSAYLVHLVV